jgi:hybrid cluster-associated redox disulfide protein
MPKTKTAKSKKGKITEKSTIMEVVQKNPETIEVFMKHGLHCIGCTAAQFESIEEGCQAHGIDAEKLVADLNKAVSKKK